MPVRNHMCPKYPAKSWVPSWPFSSVQAYRKSILDGSSLSCKLHRSDYQLQSLKQSTCSSNFLYLSQGTWGITLGKELKQHGLKVFGIFNLLLSPALLPTPNQNSWWTEQQISLRKDSMVTPILSSQVAKHGPESKAVPKDDRTIMLQGQQSLGADRDTPGMCHSCLAGTHLNKTLRNLSSWLFQAAQQHPEPREASENTDFLQSTTDVLLLPQPCFSDPACPQHSRACQTGSQGLPGAGTTFHGGSVLTAILADIKHCSF